ncbi:TauD/TfdA family dioxygenase [Marivibrio halodurans]|uniref:TauD/TfdA family dioxygenase n=1 Tax=Marivibrio halodurans TaxID=2039722 RepID=A0A8J7S6A1_9PROT|nr:TauD/TfdA family dioxygenase [Marivibrio halodurans]MBP5856372.1 TauD/TfdA family dioxygenase [Marivibrio halodurans]
MTHGIEAAIVSREGYLHLRGAHGRATDLHPLWLRERGDDPADFDPVSRQRLFEPCELPEDLAVHQASLGDDGRLRLGFSDGGARALDLYELAIELGWLDDPLRVPAPEPWTAATVARTDARWDSLDDPAALRTMLEGFFRTGFCILNETPREPGSLLRIAARFGYLRETNFGPLFDVRTKPDPIDLAYTGNALAAHADNPYRRPVPGIQMLHCLETTVEGGRSTLVDGEALVAALEEEMPEAVRVLETMPVRFVYDSTYSSLETRVPMIERWPDGRLKTLRFSPRLDYVPPVETERLTLFYRGRRRLHDLARDPAFRIEFRLEPGMLMMMDNHRLLHGRTAFDSAGGFRHLQGCYIDHDGPESLYRVLARGGMATEVGREVA